MVITRFAPSPTGFLHIGGARTALFAWLFARHHKGKFILRIEDTDIARSTEEAVSGILEAMQWLGLNYDEGPYYQTHRKLRYQEIARKLITDGKAYYCKCSQERLTKLREDQLALKVKPKYDNHCRDLKLPYSTQSVIRFRNPIDGLVTFNDEVYGTISINNNELDDLVIIRSDGLPTYNFGVVVDDIDMNISHVIRGDDHINNTPRQINIIEALNYKRPVYAHVPMILNEEGQKLSKRRDAVNVMHYKEEGFLTDAIINYLARLSWSHGDQEIFSRDQLIELFDLKKINRSAASFNLDKLLWLNRHYLKSLNADDYNNDFKHQIEKLGGDLTSGPPTIEVTKLLSTRYSTLKELAENVIFLYKDITIVNNESVKKYFDKSILPAFENITQELSVLSLWDESSINQLLKRIVETYKLKFPQIAQPLRLALTGMLTAPSIDVVIFLMGREKVINRLKDAMKQLLF